jgi:hypothetical protein
MYFYLKQNLGDATRQRNELTAKPFNKNHYSVVKPIKAETNQPKLVHPSAHGAYNMGV